MSIRRCDGKLSILDRVKEEQKRKLKEEDQREHEALMEYLAEQKHSPTKGKKKPSPPTDTAKSEMTTDPTTLTNQTPKAPDVMDKKPQVETKPLSEPLSSYKSTLQQFESGLQLSASAAPAETSPSLLNSNSLLDARTTAWQSSIQLEQNQFKSQLQQSMGMVAQLRQEIDQLRSQRYREVQSAYSKPNFKLPSPKPRLPIAKRKPEVEPDLPPPSNSSNQASEVEIPSGSEMHFLESESSFIFPESSSPFGSRSQPLERKFAATSSILTTTSSPLKRQLHRTPEELDTFLLDFVNKKR